MMGVAMSDLLLVFPEVSEDLVSNMMVAITKKIDESGSEIAIQGFLGGEHGYGAHYKNDVFEMRPFYWGDCVCHYDTVRSVWEEKNKHTQDCYQTIYHNKHYVDYAGDGGWNFDLKEGHDWRGNCGCIEETCAIFGIDPELPGGAVHCTCGKTNEYAEFIKTISHADHCEMDKPNFYHYASGIKVEWYKYIGRDMEYDEDIPIETWVNVFKECINSIGKNETTRDI